LILQNKIDRLAFWVCVILLALLPFHAFLFTWFHSFFWQQDFVIFVQAWKEILLGILGILALFKLFLTLKFPSSKSFWLGFSLILLAVVYLVFDEGILLQRVLGLRNLTLFLGIFLAVKFFDFEKERVEKLKKIVLIASGLVVLFALLQKFILPPDFLVSFGYSENVSSWLPGGNLPAYHLVEGKADLIRLQSTFAGPNQLAAFLIVILPFAISELWRKLKSASLAKKKVQAVWEVFLILGGVLTLIFTFSRSAWLGGICIFLVFAIYQWRKNLPKKIKQKLLFGGVLGIIALALLTFFQPNFREIFLRDASTLAHFERSREAFTLMLQNPLGVGLGETGGVSQRFENSLTPENSYLSFALELGWLGGILFLAFFVMLLFELRKSNSPLFFSLVGVLTIMFFLHPLEDAPTALILFLLAGLNYNSAKIQT